MTISITCPNCGRGYNLAVELRGKKVRCKGCQESFVVKETSAEVEDAEEEDSKEAPQARIRTGPRSTRKELPTPAAVEEDDRPRRRDKKRPGKKQSSGVSGVLIGGIVAGVLLLVGGAVGAIWMFSTNPPAPSGSLQANLNPPAAGGQPGNNPPQPPVQPVKPVQPPVNPPATNPPAVNPPAPNPPVVTPAANPDGPNSLPKAVPPPGWQQYVHPNKWYAVWLPKNGWKTEQTKNVPFKGTNIKINAMNFEARDKTKIFSLFVEFTLKPGEQFDRLAVMEAFRDRVIKDCDGGVVAGEKEVTLGNFDATRVTGMEYQIDLTNGEKARIRIFTSKDTGKATNLIAVIGTKEQVEGDTAKYVFSSYRHAGMLRAEPKLLAAQEKPKDK